LRPLNKEGKMKPSFEEYDESVEEARKIFNVLVKKYDPEQGKNARIIQFIIIYLQNEYLINFISEDKILKYNNEFCELMNRLGKGLLEKLKQSEINE
jgi:hypothetical protein